MSWSTVSWVYAHSPLTNAGPFSVHVAMADVVNPEHQNEFWMSMDKLARKSRTSRATAKRTVADLIELGLLRVLEVRPGGTTKYRMIFPDGAPITYDPAHGDLPPDDEGVGHGEPGGSRVTREGVGHGEPGGGSPRATNKKVTKSDKEVELEPRASDLFGNELRDEPITPRAGTRSQEAFEGFWGAYPKRQGVKVGKAAARKLWGKLGAADRDAAVAGLEVYAAAKNGFPEDAERYLRHRRWEGVEVDPVEEVPVVLSVPSPRAGPLHIAGEESLADLELGVAALRELRKGVGK